MDYTVSSYLFYLVVSVGLTVWVARTLHRAGRFFLIDALDGNEELADSVNHMLVVGFYLINVGWVSLMLSQGTNPRNLQGAIEFLSWKIGMVLLILGGMHFFNLYVLSRTRRRASRQQLAQPMEPRRRTSRQHLAPPVKSQEHSTGAGEPGPQEQQIARPVELSQEALTGAGELARPVEPQDQLMGAGGPGPQQLARTAEPDLVDRMQPFLRGPQEGTRLEEGRR